MKIPRPWSLQSLRYLIGMAITLALLANGENGNAQSVPNGAPKFVFLFLSDGGGMAHLEIARQYSRHIHNEGFVIVDKMTPYDLWKEIVQEKNMALAVLVGALSIGICIIIAAAVH